MAASGVFSLLLRYCFQICDTKTTDALDIFELPICWGSILQLAGSCAIDAALHLFMRLQPERLASAKGGESNCWWLKDPAWPECFSDHRKNGERQPTTWAPNRSLYRKWGYNYKPSKWPEIKWETVFFFFPFSPLYVALWAPTCNWLSGAHFGWTTRFHQKKSHGFPMEKTVKNYSVSLGKGLKKWCLKPFSLNVAILTNSLHLNNPGTANLYNTYG